MSAVFESTCLACIVEVGRSAGQVCRAGWLGRAVSWEAVN